MASEAAVEAARFRGTDAAKVSPPPRAGIPQRPPRTRAVRARSVRALEEEQWGGELEEDFPLNQKAAWV